MEQLRFARNAIRDLEESANKASLVRGECGRCIERLHEAHQNIDAVMKRESGGE